MNENSISTQQFRVHLRTMLDRVLRGEQITITRHGQPIAILLPISDSGVALQTQEGPRT